MAKIVAGTFVEDKQGKAATDSVYAWLQEQCRSGSLRKVVDSFVESQQEILDPDLTLVENIGPNALECVIPCKLADHESRGTFLAEIRFKIDPTTGQVTRISTA
jgi:hypothetical protein